MAFLVRHPIMLFHLNQAVSLKFVASTIIPPWSAIGDSITRIHLRFRVTSQHSIFMNHRPMYGIQIAGRLLTRLDPKTMECLAFRCSSQV
ncbi:hypothetical protein Leryth_021687, partial [Lithospermum erythrorhizon]